MSEREKGDSMKGGLAILALLLAGVTYASADDTKKDDIAACAVALAPDVTIMNASSSLKQAWVRLITEKTYEAAKTQIQSSGSVDLLGLIGANGSNNYDQFNEKRREYLNLDAGQIQDDRAVSIFRQTLPPQAGEHFIQCVNIALTGSSGLHAWFSDENANFAILHVKFRGSPNTSVAFRIASSGGAGTPATATLPHDGEIQYNIRRIAAASQIRVVLTSTNPPGLSDSAVSVRPTTAIAAPKPTLIPEQTWSLAVAGSTKKCEYTISGKDMKVMAYDLPVRSGLVLRIVGSHVTPEAGDYPIAPSSQSDYTILATRQLVDIELGPASKLVLFGSGEATATLLTTPAAVAGCPSYSLKFSSASIVVRQPPPVYTESAQSVSETLEYKRSGNYALLLGNVGCPNCGNLYAADLTAKLSQPVARFEAVSFVSQSGSSQWYRCYSVTPVCETSGETTATTYRKSGSCVGQNSCISWRFTTDGNEAGDIYTLQYRSKQCIRYCAP